MVAASCIWTCHRVTPCRGARAGGSPPALLARPCAARS